MDRTFKATDRFGSEIEFEIKPASFIEEREAEMDYRIAYAKSLEAGVLPREKMREILRSNGVWSDEEEKHFNNTARDLALKELELQKAIQSGEQDEATTYAGELAQIRTRLWELFFIQQSAFLNSCEGYAEIIRQESLMAACTVVKATGYRYWKNYHDYVEERDANRNANVAENALGLNTRLSEDSRQDMVGAWPEQQWLDSVRKGLLQQVVDEQKAEIQNGEGVEGSSAASETDAPKTRPEGVETGVDRADDSVGTE